MSAGTLTRSAGPPSNVPVISKSKFLMGLQCPRLLWHAVNDSQALPEADASQQAIFDQGKEVGQLAKRMFPGAVDVCPDAPNFGQALQVTTEATKSGKPLCEAAFAAAGGCCRVDILAPCPGGEWEIVEVKSSTSVKDEQLDDVAFQTWVVRQAGVPVRRTRLLTINNEFVRSGEINPRKFFVDTDVTAEIAPLTGSVQKRLSSMQAAIRLPKPPEMNIGPHCDDPYTCLLHDQCWSVLPDGNVLELYHGKKKGFDLLSRGITRLTDIPKPQKLSVARGIQKMVASSGKPHINTKALAAFLKRLRYPVHYLDFETFATAIPFFDGARPYQQVPFQFSLHVVRAPGAVPEHVMFLAEGRHDPRPEFMQCLRDAIGPTGSIVAYNTAFELARLRECSDAMPQYSSWLKAVERRFVDLLKPFRNFAYYHPQQHGSASMKVVLPALTGKGYAHLAIQEGGTASLEFLRVTFGNVDEAERQRVRRNLELYCGQDTEGMIWIMNSLNDLVR